jgi:hypothetical protein
MQPYWFPYIAYFQLVAAVDTFVEYDDVNYINRGWINRNFILLQGRPHLLTVPLKKASQNKKINEIEHALDEKIIVKILKTIGGSYKNAPFFDDVFALTVKVMTCNKASLADFIHYSLKSICKYIGIDTLILRSSQLDQDHTLSAAERLMAITKSLNGARYINAINGKKLYRQEAFEANGINLQFIDMQPIQYKQFGSQFIPNLSILDVLMFNPINRVQHFLNSYNLV